jgi:hypothetical protein
VLDLTSKLLPRGDKNGKKIKANERRCSGEEEGSSLLVEKTSYSYIGRWGVRRLRIE